MAYAYNDDRTLWVVYQYIYIYILLTYYLYDWLNKAEIYVDDVVLKM